MANDGKIYITISDERGGGKPTPEKLDETKDKEENKKRALFNTAYDFLKSQAKQFVNYSINNIGNFTGNYQAQRDAQHTMSLVNTAIGIGSAFAVNWVAGVAAVASNVINYGYGEYSGMIATRQQNHQINMIRNLSGMNTLLDGSRGTNG